MSDATDRGAVPHEDTFGLSGDLAAALAPAPEAEELRPAKPAAVPPAPPSATSDASAASVLAPAVVHTSKDDVNDDAAYGLDSEIPVSPPRAPLPSEIAGAAGGATTASSGTTAAPAATANHDVASTAASPVSPAAPAKRLASGSKWVSAQASVRMMTFIERVGKMAAHARPSKLRELSFDPAHSYAAAIVPRVSPDGSKVIDCPANPTTGAPADVDAPTVTVQFVQAMDVPDAEMSRKISHALLRACLFDRGEFIGNVAVVPATRTTDAQGVAAWRFGEGDGASSSDGFGYHLLARSDRKRPPGARSGANDLQLHVELNVVPVATAEEAAEAARAADAEGTSSAEAARANNAENTSPASPRRGEPAAVDEICVAWGRAPWPDPGDFKSAGHTTVDVALHGAGIEDPVALESSDLAKERAGSFFRKFTAKGKLLAKGPTIRVKICALRKEEAHLANKLPRQMLCPAGMVAMLATYRETCATEAFAANRNLHANSCNPTLRCLPALTQNPAIVEQLVEAWRRATARWSPAQLRDGGRRGETLDGLALKFWPLLRARALPPPSVAGDAAARTTREKIVRAYAEEHPVAALSRAPDDWMHAPFDVAELAHNFGDGVDAYK